LAEDNMTDFKTEPPGQLGDTAARTSGALMRQRAHDRSGPVVRWAARYALLILLAVLVSAFWIHLPGQFGTIRNISNMLSSESVDLILVLGLIFPLTAGDFDLSIAANMLLSSTVIVLTTNDWHWPALIAAIAGVSSAVVVGVVNAVLIVKVGLNAFIVTLGTMTIVSALALALTHQSPIVFGNSGITTAMNQLWLKIPTSAYYVWALALIIWYVLEKTPLGRYLRVTGTARSAARRAGVPTVGLRYASFILAAAFAGLAGVVLTATVGSVDASTSAQYLLAPYTAAFLGTAVITLGRFNVVGSLIAVYIIVVATTGLQLMGISSWVEELVSGVLLLFGLLMARILSGSRQAVVGHFD
jgi:ribose transport system permease protein